MPERGPGFFDVPLWILLLLIGLPIGMIFYRDYRAARRNIGLCHKCFYDLAGNTSGVCPECGHIGCASE